MKFLRQGLALGLLTAGLAAVPLIQAQAGASGPAEPSIVDRMRAQADGTVRVSTETATGKVGFVRASEDLMPGRAADGAASAAAKADAYLDKYAAAFGARPDELVRDQVAKNDLGWTVMYVQRYRGVPVFGAMLRANLDAVGNLTAVNGYAAPGLDLSVTPARSAAEAGDAAVAAVKADPPGHDGEADTSGIKAASTELAVYRLGSPRGDVGETVLVYVVEVSNGANVRDMVFIDANTGKPVNRYSLVHDALFRELYEGSGTPQAPVITKVWEEGQPTTGLNQSQLDLIDGTGESYWFFRNGWGRDSYDGAGARMRTVNNDPRINCPNANWNGVTTNYCNGVTSDDVVAHEWGHAYTEYTWDGIYQWQPGALNEAYSDIWGETVDLINGRMDGEEGDINAKRPDGLCSSHSPALPRVIINSPASIAKICAAGAAQFGPQLTQTGITQNVVLGLDAADAAGPETTDACSPLTNATAVAGNIAIVDRGTCGFTVKVKNAQNAGAIAVIVGNTLGRGPFGMAGVDPTITIPSVGISNADRDRIVGALLGSAVNVTMKDASTAAKTDSYRWLMGEDSTAFGGAIRDMWMPTCYGDPGKVSDAEYHCTTDDGGGVHSNSGVPNHAYALLVDGGTYNGQTITGIGLDKAAAIYFRAMDQYQTPTTDFVDHANALEASCAALTGTTVNKLSTATNAPPVVSGTIAATDCAQVSKVIAAVELRTEPVQCNFQPLLDPNTPALCGSGFKQHNIWKEDFEDGLAGWGSAVQYANPANNSLPWRASTSAPGGHAGGAAYGVGTGEGDCSGGPGDYSSRDSIVSPPVELPNTLRFPRLSFDHYVATEAGWDGGNVKISINGGAYSVVPASAFIFNDYNATLNTAAAGNSSPMAGEQAFSGTDGGEVVSTWGQSQVNLEAAGVSGGDVIQFRFDFGRDGCGGVDGWYVDNVTVSDCKVKAKVSGAHVPEPSTFGQPSQVNVTVSRDGSVGEPLTGDVVLSEGSTTLGTKTLSNGQATFDLPASFPVGRHTLTATYQGNASTSGASDTIVATVVAAPGPGPGEKADSTTTLKVKPRNPDYKEDWKAKVKVKAEGGVEPTGKVKVFADGKKVGKGRLDDGKVVIKVTKNLKPGKYKVVAKYLGSSTVEPSKDKVKIRIKRD
jgi:Zn-dependent metalloprotease